MPARCRHEPAILLRLVATQQQQVADTQELQVEQLIFYILDGGTATDHMGLNGDIVSLPQYQDDDECAGAQTVRSPILYTQTPNGAL